MTLRRLFQGAIGSRQGPSCIWAPAPLAHQLGKFTPQAMNRAAKRLGPAARGVVAPQTGSDSSQGRPMLAPAPCRNMRREKDCRRRALVDMEVLMISLNPRTASVPAGPG